MGQRLARRLAEPSVLERIELGSGVELAELEVPTGWVGKSPIELDVRRQHQVTIVAIRRGDVVRSTVDPARPFDDGDVLVVIGEPDAIGRLAALS
jgi:trk system potassium uptake protein TrkA